MEPNHIDRSLKKWKQIFRKNRQKILKFFNVRSRVIIPWIYSLVHIIRPNIQTFVFFFQLQMISVQSGYAGMERFGVDVGLGSPPNHR